MINWKRSLDDVRSKQVFLENHRLPRSFSQHCSCLWWSTYKSNSPRSLFLYCKFCLGIHFAAKKNCVSWWKKLVMQRCPEKATSPAMWRLSICLDLGVSKNTGTPKSSILIGFGTIINHPFLGKNPTVFGNTHLFLVLVFFVSFARGLCVVLTWRSGLQQVHEGWGGTGCLCQFGYHRDFSKRTAPLRRSKRIRRQRSQSHEGLVHLSNEKNLGCLVYIGGYTTQLCRDYNKPLNRSLFTNQDFMESGAVFFFFRGSLDFPFPGEHLR